MDVESEQGSEVIPYQSFEPLVGNTYQHVHLVAADASFYGCT